MHLYSLSALTLAHFFHLLDLLSVSNNWTGPHLVFSHMDTPTYLRLPAFTCMLVCLSACLCVCSPACGSPLVYSRCIYSLVSHHVLNYIARAWDNRANWRTWQFRHIYRYTYSLTMQPKKKFQNKLKYER